MEKFPRLTEYLDNLYRAGSSPSCGIVIYRDHERIYERFLGYEDEEMTRPTSGKTLYNLYSCTKPVTVTAGMMLWERGLLELDAPVADYIPEMADAFLLRDGEKIRVGERMLVRHLFTMSAGFDYGITGVPVKELVKKTQRRASTRDMMSAFVSMPLLFEPGKQFRYSLCHDVLAAVMEVACGERFADILRKNIFEPLGMERTCFHMGRKEREEQMALLWKWDAGRMLNFGRANGYELSDNYDSGGAGLVSCADDYAVFADAMACGGIARNGVRLLREETVRYMASDRLTELVERPESFSSVVGDGYRYGMGLRVLADKSNGARAPIGEFGWDGAAGSCFSADPENRIGIIFTEHVFGWPSAQGGRVHVDMRNAFYEDLEGGA